MFRKLFLISFGLLGLILALAGGIKAQEAPAIDAQILYLDSRAYPQIEAFIKVVDPLLSAPINGLQGADFALNTTDNQPLSLAEVSQRRRPLHLAVLLDLTSSVSAVELANQIKAVESLIPYLTPSDQLSLLATDAESWLMLSDPTSDYDAALASLANLSIDGRAGNAYWDGVYAGVDLLNAPPHQARQALIIITDVAPNTGAGERTELEVVSLAQERGIALYGLYFEYEGDGIPTDPPQLPIELLRLAEASGGVAFGVAGQRLSADEYNDDEALYLMMQAVGELLISEYRLAFTAPFPPNSGEHDLTVTIRYQGLPTQPLQTRFSTGANPIRIDLGTLDNGQSISLPYSGAINAESSAGEIVALRVYVSDETGQPRLIETVDPAQTRFTLGLGDVPRGFFQLIVQAEDSLNNQAELSLLLNGVESLTLSWIDPPSQARRGEALTLGARLTASASVSQVRLVVDGETVETLSIGPFDEVSFTWQPPDAGDYTLSIQADDILGNTREAVQVVQVSGSAESADNEAESSPSILILFGLIVILGLLGVVGLVLLRRKGKSKGKSKTTPPENLALGAGDAPAYGEYSPPSRYNYQALAEMREAGQEVTQTNEMPRLDVAPEMELEATQIEATQIEATQIEAPPSQQMLEAALNPPPEPTPLSEAGRRMLSTYIILRSLDGEQWRLFEGENTLGRHSSNTVHIRDEAVSRYHAKLYIEGGRAHYMDWQASHPSEINGKLIGEGEAYNLKPHDTIRIGGTLIQVLPFE